MPAIIPVCAQEPLTGNYFVANYPPFSCWTESEVPHFRRSLEQSPDAAEELGLYVHIPFCVDRCQYCYYLAYDDRPRSMDQYVDALARELRGYVSYPALAGRELAFVYFGGGTPSMLPPVLLRTMLDRLKDCFSWRYAREVTFECAPRSVTREKLGLLRDAGVTRISLGAQQLDDTVLRLNGRVHLTADVEQAYDLIRRGGFDVVNVDLIVGLVGETEESFHRSLERLIRLAPDSVTIYQLEIPHNTPLYRALRDTKLVHPLPDWSLKRERLARGFSRLEVEGYTVRSAYTAVRDPRRHAFVYQDRQYRGADLLGIGVSSFSYIAGWNQQNLASFESYLNTVSQDELPL
ncbi:MAG: coproporphyrinogen III oxidase family protein, partial [Acidobacteria bacterium]|nr:coproporphyrinogen III oxidase family protein [Acidobacteriota bacterium]